jgi:hypothetical protein
LIPWLIVEQFSAFFATKPGSRCSPSFHYWVSEKEWREADQRKAGKQEFSAMNDPTLFT